MKKLFALSLTLVCLGLFALGCEPAKKPDTAPQTPAVDTEKPADAPKADAADAAPAEKAPE